MFYARFRIEGETPFIFEKRYDTYTIDDAMDALTKDVPEGLMRGSHVTGVEFTLRQEPGNSIPSIHGDGDPSAE